MYAEQDLCRTDQTQGTCARSCRSYVSHPATRSIGYADDVDQGSVCPERHRSWIGLGSVRFMFPFRVYYNRHPGIAFGAPFSSSNTSTFQLLDKPWSQCRPFSPPVLAFNFCGAQGSAIPLLVDFSSSVANSRSRAFRKSICAQEKVSMNLYEYALRGARTHETDLYQARG